MALSHPAKPIPVILPFPAAPAAALPIPIKDCWETFVYRGRLLQVVGALWYTADLDDRAGPRSIDPVEPHLARTLRMIDLATGESIPVASEEEFRRLQAGAHPYPAPSA
jgi:hypothetical protein